MPVLASLAVAAVAVSIVPLAFHPDDLFILAKSTGSLLDIWTEPFLGRFYRPLVTTLLRFSSDVFGDSPLPLRVLQALLTAVMAALFWRLTAGLDRRARLAGLLALLGAPFTIVAIAPFAVGVADTIVAIALLLTMTRALALEPRLGLPDLGLVLVALSAKETGLLVAAFVVVVAVRERRVALVIAVSIAALAYVGFRHAVVPSQPILFGTGWFFDTLSSPQLRERFAGNLAPLYGYNVAANLLTILVYVPLKGQIGFAGSVVPYALLTGATSMFVVLHVVRGRARALAPIWMLVPLNAVLGFAYVRPRVMFIASIAIATLLARALHARRDRPWLIAVALASWALATTGAILRLWLMP